MKKISFKQKIVLIIFGLFLCVALLEVGLRIGGFIILSIQEYRNQLSIRQKGEYRILCLGESTSAAYPYILEEILNQREIGIKFSVINKALYGTNTGIIAYQLKDNLDRYNPNMVITMMGVNDDKDTLAYEGMSAKKNIPFFKSFRIYKLAKHILSNIVNMEAIKISPENYPIHLKVATWYEKQGKYQKAEEMFKKAFDIFPNSYDTCFELGRCYYHKQDYDKSVEMFKRTIEIDPEQQKAYLYLSWCYAHQGRDDKAEEILKEATSITTEKSAAYLSIGRYYGDRGDYVKVREAIEKARELIPEGNVQYVELGWWYRDIGDYDKAEDIFRKAAEINPEDNRLHNILAFLHEEQDNDESAKEYSRQISRLELKNYSKTTRHNYEILKQILTQRGVKLACMNYPMRSINTLKEILKSYDGIIFIDNEMVFKKALKKGKYSEYFCDNFSGDFGHCTDKGNRLLAENVANAILKECF